MVPNASIEAPSKGKNGFHLTTHSFLIKDYPILLDLKEWGKSKKLIVLLY